MRTTVYSIVFLISFCVICESNSTSLNDDCFMELDYGKLKGQLRHTLLKGTSFCSYKGIPYAKPPVGNLRFKDPDNTPEPWFGVKDASKEGKSCVQNDLLFGKDDENLTSEDCLFINVYTPQIHRDNDQEQENQHDPYSYPHNHNHSYAVMVWIHGGGFLFGSGNEEFYGPDFLLDHNVVLVTFNYRLGIFGFLNLGIEGASGNVGLKDQVAALLWVKKYIHLFGGNPNKVTIFGESAGAASVQYHMLSKMSAGLFHQVILQSGTFLTPWAFNKEAKHEAFQLGEILNCKTVGSNDSESLLDCLINKTSEELKITQLKVTDTQDLKRGLYFTFLPSIEVAGTSSQNFLTSHPAKLLKTGNFTKVTSLIGFNNLEGYMFLMAQNITGPDVLPYASKYFETLIPLSLGLNENSVEFVEVQREINKFFFNDQPVTWNLLQSYVNLIGDYFITVPVYRSIRSLTKHSKKPIYTYEFAVNGDRGPVKIQVSRWNPLLRNMTGASHYDDVSYLFNFHSLGELPVKEGSIEWKTIRRMTTLWTNFAKNGNPNGGEFYGWEPQQIDQETCLVIKESSMDLLNSTCEPQRIQFWKDIYETYNTELL